jgi:hypothetical protein
VKIRLVAGDILRAMAEAASRRTAVLIFQILLAVLFLAGIGAGGGYALGNASHRRQVKVATSASPGVSSSPSATGSATTRCPASTEKQVGKGNLVQVFYLSTGSNGQSGSYGSEVWICRDSGGRLWYQGHRKSQSEGPSGAPLVEGVNSLLLPDPTWNPAAGTWTATNNDKGSQYQYIASKAGLKIIGGTNSGLLEPAA